MHATFTTTKKGDRFVHVVAFKLSDSQKEQLDQSIDVLNVKGKRRSDTMRKFLEKTYLIINDYDAIKKREQSLKTLLAKCRDSRDILRTRLNDKKVPQKKYKPWEKKRLEKTPESKGQQKEEPTEQDQQPTEKPSMLWCPYRDDWVNLASCDTCKTMRFSTWKDCKERRAKDPNDPLFKPTKPKPLTAF